MGATVIDAFVATLGLDGTLFKKGMKEAEEAQNNLGNTSKRVNREREQAEEGAAKSRKRRQQEEETGQKNSLENYKKIRNELLSIAAIFTAGKGIKDFFVDTINGAANLGYLSQNLRLTTQELTSWQRASERAGGSAQGIIAQLKESQDTLAQLRSGFGPNEGLQNFFRFGGKDTDLKDGNTYLLARSRIIADMFNQDPAKAQLIAKSMGISEDQFNFLKQGPDAVMDLVKAQEKNAAVTARDAEEALKLKNRLLDLRDSLVATGTRVAVSLIPVIDMLVDRLTRASDWVVAHKDDIARWIDNTLVWVKKFADQADRAATAVGGWQNVLLALGGLKFVSLLGGLGAIATGIGGIVAAATSLPGVLAALASLGFVAGYKGAEAVDKWLHKPKEIDDDVHRQNKAILAGGTGNARAKSKEELRAEAARQMAAVTGGKGIVDKLRAMGWSAEQAAGIAGSFMQESNLDPSARNSTSGAYGIGQWLGSRVSDFKSFTGRDLVGSSLDDQLRFFQYEVTQGKEKRAGDLLRAAQTAEEAARIHSEAYERPGRDEANIARRQRLAAQFAAGGRSSNLSSLASMPSGAAASIAGTGGGATSTSTTDVKVDTIVVHTQATDAPGIAQAIGPAVERYAFTTQANTGMR